jgi:hypothetical protein
MANRGDDPLVAPKVSDYFWLVEMAVARDENGAVLGNHGAQFDRQQTSRAEA